MKITAVKAVPASGPKGLPVARNFVYVKIQTDEGIVGWGEATSGPLAVATMDDNNSKSQLVNDG